MTNTNPKLAILEEANARVAAAEEEAYQAELDEAVALVLSFSDEVIVERGLPADFRELDRDAQVAALEDLAAVQGLVDQVNLITTATEAPAEDQEIVAGPWVIIESPDPARVGVVITDGAEVLADGESVVTQEEYLAEAPPAAEAAGVEDAETTTEELSEDEASSSDDVPPLTDEDAPAEDAPEGIPTITDDTAEIAGADIPEGDSSPEAIVEVPAED